MVEKGDNMKRYLYTIIAAAIMLLVGVSCSDKEGEGSGQDASETIVNVDVIMPESMRSQYKSVIDMAQQNISSAQQSLDKKVILNLRYHDEDKEDIDQLAKQLLESSNGDTCNAVIGPFRDNNAKTMLGHVAKKDLPVILPTCTNTELQRIYSRSKNIWFLTESTTTQCEIMLHCIHQLYGTSAETALVHSNDTIGKTYQDYFGRFATELKLDVAPKGICVYQEGNNTDYRNLLQYIRTENHFTTVCMALSKVSDLKTALDSLNKIKNVEIPFINIAEGNRSIMNELDKPAYAITPLYSPTSGFAISYNNITGEYPLFGEAQIYDALSIVALGAAKRLGAKDKQTLYIRGEKVDAPKGEEIPAFNDWMRATVADDSGDESNWTATGLNIAFRSLGEGSGCNVTGATGTLDFDTTTGTKILNTYYGWIYFSGEAAPTLIAYLSTSGQGEGSYISTKSTWEWELFVNQQFDQSSVDYMPIQTPCLDHWALLITPSTKWENYRHQADVFAIYQLLRSHGYPTDHIITISEDNLATSSKNAGYDGQIFIEKDGKDVRSGCKVDYHFSDLTRDDIKDIMLGKRSTHLPKVFETTKNSNIFVFWSGHGSASDGALWGDADARYCFGSDRMREIVTEMKKDSLYRRMMMVVETCYSGLWGKALEGVNDLVVLTSANEIESSHADGYDEDRRIFYRNAVTKTFYDELIKSGSGGVSLLEFYNKLAKTTTDSHVRLYNESHYGSVYSNYMDEFFPE